MSKPLKYTVNTKDSDGNDITLAILLPSAQVKQKAQLVRAKAWADAVREGAIVREQLDQFLRANKLWDDARQAEYDRLRRVLLDGKLKLETGGCRLSQARDIALEMRAAREDLSDLLAQRNRIDANTADAIADQRQFDYLVAAVTVYNDTKKPYFTVNGFDPSVDAYIEKSTEQCGIDAATKLADVMYGSVDETDNQVPEVSFLKKYKFIDEKGRLIDKNGRLVDQKGRLINEDGRFINEAGEFVDADGKRVDENGNYVVEFSPFLDDDGNPVVEEEEATEVAPQPDSETN